MTDTAEDRLSASWQLGEDDVQVPDISGMSRCV